MYTEDKLERVNTQETKRLQFKWWTYNTITTTNTTQGTADGDKNVVARILAWQYAEDIDKLHAHKPHTPFGYARPGSSPPLQLRWLGHYHCRPKVLVRLVRWTNSFAVLWHSAGLKAKIQGSQLTRHTVLSILFTTKGRRYKFIVRGSRSAQAMSWLHLNNIL